MCQNVFFLQPLIVPLTPNKTQWQSWHWDIWHWQWGCGKFLMPRSIFRTVNLSTKHNLQVLSSNKKTKQIALIQILHFFMCVVILESNYESTLPV